MIVMMVIVSKKCVDYEQSLIFLRDSRVGERTWESPREHTTSSFLITAHRKSSR